MKEREETKERKRKRKKKEIIRNIKRETKREKWNEENDYEVFNQFYMKLSIIFTIQSSIRHFILEFTYWTSAHGFQMIVERIIDKLLHCHYYLSSSSSAQRFWLSVSFIQGHVITSLLQQMIIILLYSFSSFDFRNQFNNESLLFFPFNFILKILCWGIFSLDFFSIMDQNDVFLSFWGFLIRFPQKEKEMREKRFKHHKNKRNEFNGEK